MTPFRIRDIDHLVLRARDQAALVRFYCDVLGCSIEKRQDAIGLVQLRAGSSLIDIVGVDGKLGRLGGAAPGSEGRNLDHFCLRVDRSISTRSARICSPTACSLASMARVTAQKAKARRCTSATSRATWSS